MVKGRVDGVGSGGVIGGGEDSYGISCIKKSKKDNSSVLFVF